MFFFKGMNWEDNLLILTLLCWWNKELFSLTFSSLTGLASESAMKLSGVYEYVQYLGEYMTAFTQ